MAKKKGNLIGAWAFLIGVILAIVIGLLKISLSEGLFALILIVLGLVIGLFNIGASEIKEFLLAGTVLVIVSSLGGQTYLGLIPYVGDIIGALVILFVPATIVVALKAVFVIAKK